jgi:hypothetical protein
MLVRDARIAFIMGSFLPFTLVGLFSDALPPKLRKHTSILCLSLGAMSLCGTIASLYWNTLEVEHISYTFGFISVSLSSLACSTIINLLMYYLKCIRNYMKFENTFAVLKSRMEVVPTTKEMADTYIASFELVNSMATDIREKKRATRMSMSSSKKVSKVASSPQLEVSPNN